MIQAPKLGRRILRYEFSDREWDAINPMLPNKPRGMPRVDNRRVLNGIFWVLRSGAPWRDLPAMDPNDLLQPLRSLAGRRPGPGDLIRQTRGQLSGLHQTRINPNLVACS